jgi:nicotinate phosphoribosyltransferase
MSAEGEWDGCWRWRAGRRPSCGRLLSPNVAAAMRCGLQPVGTMAHSYVMSFAEEQEAFRTFMEDTPETRSCWWTRTARSRASPTRSRPPADRGEAEGRPARLRRPPGSLASDTSAARRRRDGRHTDRRQRRSRGAPDRAARRGRSTDRYLGTEMGTSRDAPALGGVYKLVADALPGGRGWRPVWKRLPAKAHRAGTEAGVSDVQRRDDGGRSDR